MKLERKTIETTVLEFNERCVPMEDIPKEYLQEGYYLYASSGYDGDIEISIEHHTLEPEEEYNKRVAEQKEREENAFKMHQKREYQEYLALKAKFEGNGEG